MPRPQYDRQKVLQWYASLNETLKEAGINFNNPRDLARVKAYYFKELSTTKDPGNPEMYDDEKMLAFIPKKFNDKHEMDGYTVNRPHLPNAAAQNELDDLLKDNLNANYTYNGAHAELIDAYKSGDVERIEQAEKNLVNRKEDVINSFNNFRSRGNQHFADYYQWMYGNQKTFDPQTDYDQIEELYNCAMEGRLYINPLDSNPEDRWQIVVTNNGAKSEFSKTGASQTAPTVDANVLFSAMNTIKKGLTPTNNMKPVCDIIRPLLPQFEAENGIIGKPDSVDMFPFSKHVDPAPKPGFLSWVKRIASFGFANSDFKKYEEYQKFEKLRQDNLKVHDQVMKFANKYAKELGIQVPEGTMNPGEVENNRLRMHNAEFCMGEERPDKELYCDGTNTVMIRHAQIVEHEVHENPTIIGLGGRIDEEKSNEFWKDKELVLPITQGDRDKAMQRVNEQVGEIREKYLSSKELAKNVKEKSSEVMSDEIEEIEKDTMAKKTVLEKAKDEKDLSMLKMVWLGMESKEVQQKLDTVAKMSVNERFEQLGKLAGVGPDKQVQAGMYIFASCLTRNREFLNDGTDRDPSTLRSNLEVKAELDKLIELTEDPSKIKQQEYKKLFDSLKNEYFEFNKHDIEEMKQNPAAPKLKLPSTNLVVDSAASMLSLQNVDSVKNCDTTNYVTACICHQCARKLDLGEGFVANQFKEESWSIKEEREKFSALGEDCLKLNNAAIKYRKNQNVIKEVKEKGILPEVKDLELGNRQSEGLNLIKEPGLYN